MAYPQLMADPRYPIGTFEAPEPITPELRQGWIERIATLPGRMREVLAGLEEARLDTPYREGGWTLRQVVHHVPDSHMNAYIRFKLALTEDTPTIRPYNEEDWARLGDTRDTPIETSLQLLENLHRRWVMLLQSLSEADYRRAYIHPESGRTRLDQALGSYAWHGDHHLAHITELRKRMGW